MNSPTHHPVARAEHSPDAPLSIHAMTVAYDRRPVLWDIDLDIPPGSLVGVIGPNGAAGGSIKNKSRAPAFFAGGESEAEKAKLSGTSFLMK